MKTAVALMELADGNNEVFRSAKGARFHEDRECPAMRAGHLIWACLCGDWQCGCKADPPPVVCKLPIARAAVLGLVPCDICYPGFQELAVQLPSEDDFGHRPTDEYGANRANVSRIVCSRCIDWSRIRVPVEGGGEEIYLMGRRVSWPCTSAQVLGLVPRQDERIP